MHVDKKNLKIMSTVAFGAAILSEVTHSVVKQVPWEGYTLVANNISFFLIAIWGFSIASLWSAKTVYKPALVVGVLLLGAHSLVLSIGGNKDLVAFYACMFVVALLGSFYSSRITAANTGGHYGL